MRIINGQRILSDTVAVSTDDFDGALSGSDDTAQKAFDTLDDGVDAKLDNVVEDVTPQLGGTLDSQNKDIDNSKTITFNTEYDNGTKADDFTLDLNNGQKQTVVLNAVSMTITLTAPPGPGNFLLKLVQDDTTGSRTVIWPGSVLWVDGTAPTLSTATDAIDVIALYYDGTNYLGVASLAFS